jgi:VWFA-related protein
VTGAASLGSDLDPGIDPGRATFGERVTVRLTSLSLRAVDRKGRPLEDLAPEDFILEIGGERVPVASVDWVSSSSNPLAELSPAQLVEHDIVVPPPGKLVVLYVQSDLHPLRAKGQLKMLDHVPELLDTLHRDDHVAVVSYDSHLKLQLDFTRDTSLVPDAVLAGIRRESAEWPKPMRPPALAHELDPHLAKRAATPERGLELTADALAGQGDRDKVIVFLGWGLGRFGAFGVTETHAFRAAEDALQRASIPLFVLDITDADNHTLEVALSQLAWATGGAYVKTYLFPGQAANRIAASMTGHYRLYYAPPEDASARDRLKVRLAHHKGEILLASGAGR